MTISIITVCYNSERTIARTIESVLAQEKVRLEYLIIDGASKDKTVEIAESYKDRFVQKGISYVVKSEPDKGIYDAMNKGVLAATGDIIGILNSDDYYADSDVLSSVESAFLANRCESVYGNLLYIKNGKPYRYWKSGKPRSFRFGWMPPHPAFFVKKEMYKKYGIFRLDCGTAADYELMLRFLERNHVSTIWINKIFTYMEAGGASNHGLQSRIIGINNDRIAWEKNNIKPERFTILFKKLRKIPQFLGAKRNMTLMKMIHNGWGGVYRNRIISMHLSLREAA